MPINYVRLVLVPYPTFIKVVLKTFFNVDIQDHLICSRLFWLENRKIKSFNNKLLRNVFKSLSSLSSFYCISGILFVVLYFEYLIFSFSLTPFFFFFSTQIKMLPSVFFQPLFLPVLRHQWLISFVITKCGWPLRTVPCCSV